MKLRHIGLLFRGLVLVAAFTLPRLSEAADPHNYLSAVETTGSSSITLKFYRENHWSFPKTDASIYRTDNLSGTNNWGSPIATVPWSETTTYVDSTAAPGVRYLYRVDTGNKNSYIAAGIKTPAIEDNGILLLVTDNVTAPQLVSEINLYKQDLVGSGYQVKQITVSPSDSPPEVKAKISAAYNEDPIRTTSLVLLGDIPVPFSGWTNPDGHGSRPFPADAYYGDIDGNWTDNTVNNSNDTNSWWTNHPGDGKFDQTQIPSDVDLQVGRISFNNLPAYSESNVALLRRYLQKNHSYRHNHFTFDENLYTGENQNSHTGYLASGPLFGTDYRPFVKAGMGLPDPEFWDHQENKSYWLSCWYRGGGSYVSTWGMGTVQDFAESPGVNSAIFTSWASFYGEWDVQNAFLRSILAAKGKTMAVIYAGSPVMLLHPMGAGETIGYAFKMSLNGEGFDLPSSNYKRQVVTDLLGDPTIRLFPVSPPTDLQETDLGSSVELSWTASQDTDIAGYYIYRAEAINGQFERIHPDLITGTTYVDANPSSTNVYMVRAIKLQVTGSGSYYNPSQGLLSNHINVAPTVNAGNNETITLPLNQVNLDSAVSYDNLTASSTNLTTIWTKQSGPGIVTFADANAENTTATFNTPGNYILRFTANDGELQSHDEIAIKVLPIGSNGYNTNFATDVSSDVNEAQIGILGEIPETHLNVDWSGGNVNVSARYNEFYTTVLDTSDDGDGINDNNDGWYTGNVDASLEFQFVNGDSSNVRTIVAVRQNANEDTNTYVMYYALMSGDTISIRKQTGYTTEILLATQAFATSGGTSTYTITLSAKDIGDTTQLTASLKQDGAIIAHLSATDTNSPLTSGYNGWGIGAGPTSSGTFRGAQATAFWVNSVPIPNTAPIATADSYNTNTNTPLIVSAPGLLSNDIDSDGDPLSAIKVSDPSSGTLTLNSDGSFSYTPNPDFNGQDSFTYKANDGTQDSNTTTVTISVDASESATLVGSHLFYNNSSFDTTSDNDAIAIDKQPLLHGQTATFNNYSSYVNGLNGIMIDIADNSNLSGLSASDFEFRIGNTGIPSNWTIAPPPQSIYTLAGSGESGSDRVVLTWADHAIKNQWLEIRILANANTGFTEDQVFYFGNIVGETGNSPTDAKVNLSDIAATRSNQTGFGVAAINNKYDHNRDGRVNLSDISITRTHQSGFTPVILITPN
ncbi:Ig-like domain-containing protein [Poriferisphaera sp. WC338]|uniref:Ig-like domain-containing protein n=1 Tax=Poriferisphaera sp. WC338 TaxID=3425129 RepID=UPI003D81BCD6